MPAMQRLSLTVMVGIVVLLALSSSTGALESPGVSNDYVTDSRGLAQHTGSANLHKSPLEVAGDGSLGRTALDGATEAGARRSEFPSFEEASMNKDFKTSSALSSRTGARSASSTSSSTAASTSSSTTASSSIVRNSAAVSVTLTLAATDTDSTLASKLCPLLNATVSELSVFADSDVSAYFTLPTCVPSSASSLISFGGIRVRFENVSVLPASTSSFYCLFCVFGPGTGIAATGFNATGDMNWDEWFWHMPTLVEFVVTYSDIRGSLPTALPHMLTYFQLTHCPSIGGVIPDTFLPSTFQPLTIIIQDCSLIGPLPQTLFAPLANMPISQITFAIANNLINGTIPPSFFSPLENSALVRFTLYMSNNKLEGPVPALPTGLLASTASSATGAYFDLNLSNNQLTGPVPAFAHLGTVSQFTLSLLGNRLSSLPPALFVNVSLGVASELEIDLSYNALSGSIPATLVSMLAPPANISVKSFILNLAYNRLEGTIPSQLFSHTTSSSVRRDSITSQGEMHGGSEFSNSLSASQSYLTSAMLLKLLDLNLSNNSLTGSLPNVLMGVLERDAVVKLYLDNNVLSDRFPVDLALAFRNSTNGLLLLTARNNSFVGDAPTNCNYLYSVRYDLLGNRLDGTIASTYLGSCRNLDLTVSNNPSLSGPIPPVLFSIPTLRFIAADTNLNESAPTVLSSPAYYLDLSGTIIDFCSSPFHANASTFSSSTCILDHTSACDCQSNYDGCSIDCSPATAPPPRMVPSSPAPAPTSQSAPSTCNIKTRPGPEFTCINGIWTAITTSSPVLTIPSGAGVVVVEGNVSSSTIIINGVGSKIVIGGCASNLSSIVIELSPEQVKQLSSTKSLQELLTLSNRTGNCSIDLNNVALTTKSEGCRKVSTEKIVSESGNSLGAYFVVSSSGCNTWWIVLVSVIVVVVILGTAAAVITGVLWKRHQEKKDFNRLEKQIGKKG